MHFILVKRTLQITLVSNTFTLREPQAAVRRHLGGDEVTDDDVYNYCNSQLKTYSLAQGADRVWDIYSIVQIIMSTLDDCLSIHSSATLSKLDNDEQKQGLIDMLRPMAVQRCWLQHANSCKLVSISECRDFVENLARVLDACGVHERAKEIREQVKPAMHFSTTCVVQLYALLAINQIEADVNQLLINKLGADRFDVMGKQATKDVKAAKASNSEHMNLPLLDTVLTKGKVSNKLKKKILLDKLNLKPYFGRHTGLLSLRNMLAHDGHSVTAASVCEVLGESAHSGRKMLELLKLSTESLDQILEALSKLRDCQIHQMHHIRDVSKVGSEVDACDDGCGIVGKFERIGKRSAFRCDNNEQCVSLIENAIENARARRSHNARELSTRATELREKEFDRRLTSEETRARQETADAALAELLGEGVSVSVGVGVSGHVKNKSESAGRTAGKKKRNKKRHNKKRQHRK